VKDKKIEVIDSLNCGGGEALLAYFTFRSIEDGLSFEELVPKVKESTSKIKTIIYVDTLKYVNRTGRIPKATANFGSFLSVKPIISVDIGKIRPMSLVGSRAKGFYKIIDVLKRDKPKDPLICMELDLLDEERKVFIERLRKH